ncbi:MAG: TlpA family protein disulfide reductase [Labilithrix sp.]|nr:TlpA family protein disulfide reductase [Labilithrix sp.]MCW5813396.1 TlpA family protein disulfide reductase [Labilithrix sp.]
MTARRALASLIVLGACGGSTPAAAPPSSKSSLLGEAAPSFKREALDGTKVEVGAASGKVSVVKFVAKYCKPCTRTLPAIQKLYAERPDIAIVAVSEDEHESEARELVATYHLTFPVVHDAQQVLAARWRVADLPITFVLDGKGSVAWVGGPEKTESDLVAAIEATKP